MINNRSVRVEIEAAAKAGQNCVANPLFTHRFKTRNAGAISRGFHATRKIAVPSRPVRRRAVSHVKSPAQFRQNNYSGAASGALFALIHKRPQLAATDRKSPSGIHGDGHSKRAHRLAPSKIGRNRSSAKWRESGGNRNKRRRARGSTTPCHQNRI